MQLFWTKTLLGRQTRSPSYGWPLSTQQRLFWGSVFIFSWFMCGISSTSSIIDAKRIYMYHKIILRSEKGKMVEDKAIRGFSGRILTKRKMVPCLSLCKYYIHGCLYALVRDRKHLFGEPHIFQHLVWNCYYLSSDLHFRLWKEDHQNYYKLLLGQSFW